MILSLFLTQKHTSPHPTYCQVNFSCPSAKYCQYVREASMMRMLHWLFTALVANQGHFWWQAVLVDPFTAQTKRSYSACYINNSSFRGKLKYLKSVCRWDTWQKGIKRRSRQKASWKTSMNVARNCISRSLHAVFPCIETSGPISHSRQRFKILTVSIMTYSSSWHLQTARHWPRFFLYCGGAGSVPMWLHGTAWTYICATCWTLNHSCYAVMTFIVVLQPSSLREICSQWRCISCRALSPFVWKHSLTCKMCRSVQGHFSYIWLSWLCTPHFLNS